MKVKQVVSSNGNRQPMNQEPDPQVIPKAKRRRFSVEYKRRILEEADKSTGRGQIRAVRKSKRN